MCLPRPFFSFSPNILSLSLSLSVSVYLGLFVAAAADAVEKTFTLAERYR